MTCVKSRHDLFISSTGTKEGFFCHTHTCASMHESTHMTIHTCIRTHLHYELSCLSLFLERDTWSATRMLRLLNTCSLSHAHWRRSVPVQGWMGILCHGVRLCGCFPALLISLFFISFMSPFFSSPSLRACRASERDFVTLERKLVWRKLGLDVFFFFFLGVQMHWSDQSNRQNNSAKVFKDS